MKSYVIVTGALFGLVTVAHIARLFQEGAGPFRNVWFVVMTVLSTALAIWAAMLLRSERSIRRD